MKQPSGACHADDGGGSSAENRFWRIGFNCPEFERPAFPLTH